MVGPAPLPGVQQLPPFEGKARGAVQSLEPQRTLSGPVSKKIAGTAGASAQLSIAAPLALSDQALPGTQLSGRVETRPTTQALRGGTRPPEHVETRPAVQHFAEVPASFSVYKQQKQLKEEERLLPRLKQEERQNIQDSIMPVSRQEFPSRETGGYFQSFNLPENAFPLWQQAPEVTSLPGATLESRLEESSQQTKKESATRLFLSPVSAQVWREATVQPVQPFRGIEVTTPAPSPVEPAFWPLLSSESPPSSAQTEELMQVEMPWPALPKEENTNGQDWGIAQRMWERRRRLDEEQRGNLWSV